MIEIQGVRFNCITGKAKTVKLEFKHHPESYSEHVPEQTIRISKGGVTGWESFLISYDALDRMEIQGWWARAGTTGRWDGLFIHALQMKKVFQSFKLDKNQFKGT